MSISKVRFGLIGPGRIAHTFAQDVAISSNATLEAVASRNGERAKKFATQYGIDTVVKSYEELGKLDTIDAVYIATPHNFHFEQAKMMIEMNKHVLIEKPITVNINQLEELIFLAKKHNVLIMEAFWTAFLPATHYVTNIVHKENFGNLKEINFNFGFKLPDNHPKTDRLLNKDLAGGSILDLGIYPIGTTRLMDRSKIKSMDVTSKLNHENIDLDTFVTIEYENGLVSRCHSSLIEDLDEKGKLTFENGTIYMNDFFRSQQIIVNGEVIDVPYRGNGFVHQIESFSETILSNELENKIITYNVMKDVIGILDEVRSKAGSLFEYEKRES